MTKLLGLILTLSFSVSFSFVAFSAPIDPNQLPRVEWNFASTNLNIGGFVYTPFYMQGSDLVYFTGGSGTQPNNGTFRIAVNLGGELESSEYTVIQFGPEMTHYNYFRAPRVAKNGSELWMLIEVSGCYSGCDSVQFPKRLAAYHSMNNGMSWDFLDFATVDGETYVSQWFAHTGLIYNPKGSETLNLNDLTQNRFITLGENRDIFVSADGVNYRSIPMNHPFPKDRLVFASIAKTPYGFHLTSSANWNDAYYTTTVRHLFSKDLKNWHAIESNSFMKNPKFYKGVHLSYDEASNKLWAISPCGVHEACGFLAWLEPKDYLDTEQQSPASNSVPVGEFVHINGDTAMIVSRTQKSGGDTYQVRFANGSYDSGYTKDLFTFPLQAYKRQGCIGNDICVGDPVYVDQSLATIMGYYEGNTGLIKYALKFSNGVVDTGYTREMIRLP